MTLPWAQFVREARGLQVLSTCKGDISTPAWHWVQTLDRPGFGYLATGKIPRRVTPPTTTHTVEGENGDGEVAQTLMEVQFELSMNMEPDDEATLPPTTATHSEDHTLTYTHVYEYHVVYSNTYSVPVLYFNAYKLDGRLLTWDEVWGDLPPHYQNSEIRSTFLTQNDHPVLGVPFYFIHPCETAKLMGELRREQDPALTPTKSTTADEHNYLMQWLSIVAPVIGLHVPLSQYNGTAIITATTNTTTQ